MTIRYNKNKMLEHYKGILIKYINELDNCSDPELNDDLEETIRGYLILIEKCETELNDIIELH